jgi:hypothetical protein
MINLRYHIVSLTAVFLALGIGILAGTTVINDQVVSGLRANTTALRNDLDALRTNVTDLRRELGVWDEFGKSISSSLLQGQLAGRSVVIVADDKAPSSLISRLGDAFRLANAKRPTRLVLTRKWSLDASSTSQLAETLAIGSGSSPEVLVEEAGRRIGARLGRSSDPRADDDLIGSLGSRDFIDVADLPASGPFPAANAVVVVVASGDPENSLLNRSFFVSMLRSMSSSRIVCAAEPSTAQDHVAELVRRDNAISRTVCTVDHVDTVPGQLSLVYSLRSLITGRPAEHYGIRDGATGIAPNLRPA